MAIYKHDIPILECDYTADARNYDARGFGIDSMEPALVLCLDIAVKLP